MTSPSLIRLHGELLQCDPSGVLWWPGRSTLVVADLHLEKGAALTRRGTGPLPPYDTAATLVRLTVVMDRLKPDRVIALGDSLHDRRAAQRISPADRDRVRALTAQTNWIWIAGNHDPDPPTCWGGAAHTDLQDGKLRFVHESSGLEGPSGEISGHFHPVALVRTALRRIRGRCFATDGHRLILPSFGAYTGGLNVLNPTVRTLFTSDFQAHVIGQTRIHAIPASRLIAERAA